MHVIQIGLVSISILVIFFQSLYLKILYSAIKIIIKRESILFVRIVHGFIYGLGLFYVIFSNTFFLNKPVFENISLWIVLSSLCVIVLSRKKLGIHYSPHIEIHKDHKYIKDGIYCYLNHPVYYAEIIAAFFTCFIINHPIYYFLGLPLFIFSQLVKIKKENILLRSYFPNEYESQTDKIFKLFERLKKPFLIENTY